MENKQEYDFLGHIQQIDGIGNNNRNNNNFKNQNFIYLFIYFTLLCYWKNICLSFL